MIFTIISNKMLSPPRSNSSTHRQCKATKCFTFRRKQQRLQLHILVVLSIIVCSQAAVIKKRDIPFETTEGAMTNATTALTFSEEIITATTNATNNENSDNPLSVTTFLAETTTLEPSTKLLMQSKEFVANEITLNKTEKELKPLSEMQHSKNENAKEEEVVKDNFEVSKNNIESNTEGAISYNFVYNNNNNNNKENKFESDSEVRKQSDIKTETTTSLNLVETTTPSAAIKDISIESNHIMPIGSKITEVTTENILNSNREVSEIFTTIKSVLTPVGPSKIPETIDRDSLKEISNDLPEKTTESYINLNKFEHQGRSMKEEEEEKETTFKPEIPSTTPTVPLEQLKNSIEADEFTHSPSLGEKKGKFINDNSTNAQKLNLPNNAEVWSLAGMKPQMATPEQNVTIETTNGKQNEIHENEWREDEKHSVHNYKTTTANILDLNNSEKNLYDWSEIMVKFASTLKNIEESKDNNNNFKTFEFTTPVTQISEERDIKNSPLNSVSNDNGYSKNLPNASTILSKSSFDNIPQENPNNKNSIVSNVSNSSSSSSSETSIGVSSNSSIGVITATTETVPLKLNAALNDINLTLNKTLTPPSNRGDEHSNNKNNVNAHNDFTLQPILIAAESNRNNSEMLKSTTEATTIFISTSPAITVFITESKAESTAIDVDSSAVSEPTVTFSTLETVKVNASNVSGERNEIVDNNLIDNNNNNNVRIKNENTNNNIKNNENKQNDNEFINTNNNLNENINGNLKENENIENTNKNIKLNENTNTNTNNNLNENENIVNANKKLKDKENLEIFATTTTATIADNLIPITTYKPTFVKIELNPSTTTTTTEFPFPSITSEVNSFKPLAEVDDQNGNEIESKQSINIESNGTTTTEYSISAFGFNISSTTIKTHLNEQVFETTTTTIPTPTTTTTVTPFPPTITTTTTTAINKNKNIFATTETSYEKTTSSLEKDETKINGREEEEDNESIVITTPKTSLTTTLFTSNEPEPEHLAIGSSSTTTTTTPIQVKEINDNEKEIEIERTTEIETTTEKKTPVVEQGVTEESFKESTTTTTTTTLNGSITKDTTTIREFIETTTAQESDTKTTETTTTTKTTSGGQTKTAATDKEETTTEPYQDTTIITATANDTNFKNPIDSDKGSMKEEKEAEYQTVEPKKNEQTEIEITTTPMTTIISTTSLPTTSTMNIKTTEKYIIEHNSINANDDKDNSINEFVVTTTTTATTKTSTTERKEKEGNEEEEKIETTITTTPLPSSRTTTETELKTTEIHEFHSPQTTTESTSPPTTTTTTTTTTTSTTTTSSTTEKQLEISQTTTDETEIPFITHHTTPSTQDVEFYSTIRNNFQEEFTTTMLPTTKIITADIGGGQSNAMPPLITTGTSGNSMYPKNSDGSGETDVNVIIAITVSVIGVIALILLVAFLYLMRKRQKQTSYSQRCRPVSLDEYAIDNISVGGSMRKGSVFRSSKRTYGNLAFDDPSLRHNAIGVHALAKFSSEKLRIFEEFRGVPQITAREDEVPQGCEDKNRYANVLPLPESRVILQRINDDEKTEYINANYVTGPKDTPNYYIACQAPMESTVEDFWRMIWEQQSRVIIQATDLIENGVEKCAEYLPPSVTLDNHSTFGDFQITLQNREVKDKYAISTLLLKHNGENVTRELTHYWYKWPETGVPTEEAPIIAMLLEARSSLISYAIEQANEDKEKKISNATLKSAEEGTATSVANNNGSTAAIGDTKGSNGEINGNISLVPLKKTARNQGPLTIHCSPGTGRTGTIIACDIAIRSLEAPKRIVDIPHIVYYVRRGRASAVLTKEQYEFIYKVANVYAAKISNPTTYN